MVRRVNRPDRQQAHSCPWNARVRGRNRAGVFLGAMVVGLLAGCGDPEPNEPNEPSARVEQTTTTDWPTRLTNPDVASLLAALAQPHEHVRAQVGPHRLQYSATFDLAPTTARSGAPALDDLVVETQHIEDTLALVWDEPDALGPRVYLTQSNDHERGRAIIITGGKLFAKMQHRDWIETPLETDVHELWLNDAQRCAHDIVEFAAGSLAVRSQTEPGAGLGGADAVTLTLERGPATQALAAEGPHQRWRRRTQVDEISGNLLLDLATGVWLRADIRVGYSMSGGDGRPMRGSMTLRASLTPQTPEDTLIKPPSQAAPFPERARYEIERQQILHGLAAP